MKQQYFLPQTDIIPHFTMECIQSTVIKWDNVDIETPGDGPDPGAQ